MIFTIRNCTVDTEAFEVRRDGVPVPVEPQVFDLLVLLLEAPGRVVTKEEIRERVWRGRIVSDAALSSRIKAVRRAIGDDGASQACIRTVRRRGFRVVADVRRTADPEEIGHPTTTGTGEDRSASAPPLDSSTDPPAVSPSAPPPSDRPSIAVLPFTNLAGDPGQDYLSDGIAEDIITELCRFSILLVIARNSSFMFRGQALDVADVGRRLGVRYVVVGSVRRAGERIRVATQLIDAESGNHIWAERYDRNLEDVFQVQDEIVQSVVATLAERVSAAEAARTKRRPIADMAVYDLILRAQHHMGRWTNEDHVEARKLLESAVGRDPDCAQAHAMLAWCCVVLTWFGGDVDALLAGATESGRKALSIDPQTTEAHTGLGLVRLMSGAHKQALHHFETAVQLNPNDANALQNLGYCRALTGDLEAGLETMRASMRLNPYRPDWYEESLGEVLYMARDYEAAIEAFNRMNHKPPWTHGFLAASYAQLGRQDAAAAAAAAFEGALTDGSTVAGLIARDLPMYREASVRDHWLDGYRKAGIEV